MHLSEMFYNSVVSSVPNAWKKQLKQNQIVKESHGTDEINIKANGKLIPLRKTTSKQIYEILIILLLLNHQLQLMHGLTCNPSWKNLTGVIHLLSHIKS